VKNCYWNPVKIAIGRGSLSRLAEALGTRTAVLVTSRGTVERGQIIKEILDQCGSSIVHLTDKVKVNPTFETILSCYYEVKQYNYDLIIGIGGGSALDTAKIVALLSANAQVESYLKAYLSDKQPLPGNLNAKPLIAIPTTSGSGSEVTPWATVWDNKTGNKYSISSDALYSEWALLDPKLTESLPYDTTLFSALDALSHAMEAIWNKNAGPVSDVLATGAVAISVPVLADEFKDKYSLGVTREKLQLASLLAGLAFSNTKTALAHSISYPLTGQLQVPHGLACSFTLPEVMRFNYAKYKDRVKVIQTALKCSTIDQSVDRLYEIFIGAGVPQYLRKYSVDITSVAASGAVFITPDRADNNLASASEKDAVQILRSALARLAGE
jgi:phosphonate metabolism-associated iron-containing alcohol dehydrogenase